MAATSTTIRVSRRTQQQLAQLAAQHHTSIGELLDRLVERERRAAMLADYNARMAELLDDTAERAAWAHEVELSEASAAEIATTGANTADLLATSDADTAAG